MIKIDDYFKFKTNDIIVVGCSTGPDSMALVDMLLKVREKYNLSLIVAHVNHNIRSASASELEFVKSYCENNGVIFESTILPNDKIYSEKTYSKLYRAISQD